MDGVSRHESHGCLGDSNLIEKIVSELKSQGLFDQLRKDCMADVDTKPAYQNLRQRVETSVSDYLVCQKWKPDLSKNKLRDSVRKNMYDMQVFDNGIDRIINQVINPKIYSAFVPQVEDAVYNMLGIKKPHKESKLLINGEQAYDNFFMDEDIKMSVVKNNLQNLLPNDLDPISPSDDSDDFGDNEAMKKEECDSVYESKSYNIKSTGEHKDPDEISPSFEPLEDNIDLPTVNPMADLEDVSAESINSMFIPSPALKSSKNAEVTASTSTDDDIKFTSIASPLAQSSSKFVFPDSTSDLSCETKVKSDSSKTNKTTPVDNGVIRKKEEKKRDEDRKRSDERKKEDEAKKKDEDRKREEERKREERSDKHDKSRDKDRKKDNKDRKSSEFSNRDRKTSESSKSRDSKDKSHRSSSSHDSKRHSKGDVRDKESKSEKESSRSHSSSSKDHSHHQHRHEDGKSSDKKREESKSSSSKYREEKSKSDKNTKTDHHKRDKSKEKSSSDHHKSDHAKKSDAKRSDKDSHRDKQKHSDSKERSSSHGSSASNSHRQERKDSTSKSSRSNEKSKHESSSTTSSSKTRDADTFKAPSKHDHKHSHKAKEAEVQQTSDKPEKTHYKTEDKNKSITSATISQDTEVVLPTDTTQEESEEVVLVPVSNTQLIPKKPKIAANMYEIKKIMQLRKDFDRMEKKRNKQKHAEEVRLEEENKKKESEKKKKKINEEEEIIEGEKAKRLQIDDADLHPKIIQVSDDSATEIHPPHISRESESGPIESLDDVEDMSYIPIQDLSEAVKKMEDDDTLSCISIDSIKSEELSDSSDNEYVLKFTEKEWYNLKSAYPELISNNVLDTEDAMSMPTERHSHTHEFGSRSHTKPPGSFAGQILDRSDNMGSADRVATKPAVFPEKKKPLDDVLPDKVPALHPRKMSSARKRRASYEESHQPEKRFLLPPSPAESAASTDNKSERRNDLFDIEEESDKSKEKSEFDSEAGQNGLIDSLIPTPPTDTHLTDVPEEAAASALLPPSYSPLAPQESTLIGATPNKTIQVPANKPTARGRGKRGGQGSRRNTTQQRYDSSDLYKPRPTFTPTRRLREYAANIKAEQALTDSSKKPYHDK